MAAHPPWVPAERVPSLPPGAGCTVLLSYTYAWQAHPEAALDDLLTMLEPADIATAQLSLVYSATLGGRRILEELSASQLEPLREEDLRRFLDRVWASYHRLDGYRFDSAQDHRATYYAGREIIGVDQAHGRAGELLGYVDASLQAASSRRARQLDTRLNRLAAGLTVVVAAEFAVEAAGFLMPEPPMVARILVALGVPLASMCVLLGVVLSVRRRQRQQRSRGWWHSWPTILPAPRSAGAGDREGGAARSRRGPPAERRSPGRR